ncbi:putative glutathione S-transferase [Thelonectria olida]|uniref:glutathione transferase n=1 Tax=Thelonectria olida TaxID=1576542 RepID=A0A9P8WBB9_9HYPO|nr:putative glutathione S-transferase [Thelonectria olida]
MTLTVHHLHVSQSERVVWLCEELGIDYELKTYKRAPILAPPEYKALHPLGAAPVIQDGDLTLAESGACIEYISHKHGNGKLFLPSTHADYADFLYLWHWANGTFASALMGAVASRSSEPGKQEVRAIIAKDRFKSSLVMLNERVGDKTWVAGEDFTAADIILVFLLTTVRYFYPYSLEEYPSILGYLDRIGQREAYQRAMKKCDPEMELLLGANAPARK